MLLTSWDNEASALNCDCMSQKAAIKCSKPDKTRALNNFGCPYRSVSCREPSFLRAAGCGRGIGGGDVVAGPVGRQWRSTFGSVAPKCDDVSCAAGGGLGCRGCQYVGILQCCVVSLLGDGRKPWLGSRGVEMVLSEARLQLHFRYEFVWSLAKRRTLWPCNTFSRL